MTPAVTRGAVLLAILILAVSIAFTMLRDDWGRPLDTSRPPPTRLLLPPGDSVLLYFDPKRDTRSYGAR